MKKYKVNIDMNFSQDIKVSAKNIKEAKKKAWLKFIAKKPTKKRFTIYAEETDN